MIRERMCGDISWVSPPDDQVLDARHPGPGQYAEAAVQGQVMSAEFSTLVGGAVVADSAAQGRTRVGVPRESGVGERRVALVPKVAERLIGKGLDVVVASGAGLEALVPDEMYTEVGV